MKNILLAGASLLLMSCATPEKKVEYEWTKVNGCPADQTKVEEEKNVCMYEDRIKSASENAHKIGRDEKYMKQSYDRLKKASSCMREKGYMRRAKHFALPSNCKAGLVVVEDLGR